MRIDFILRVPGKHQHIGTEQMEAVPREGDLVQLGDNVHVVHSVTWVPSENLVRVLVRT